MPPNKPAPNLLLDDCFLHDKDRLKHDEAIAILRDRLHPIVKISKTTLLEANGRYLAKDLISPAAVPGYDNSAVDGYTFNHDDYVANQGVFPLSDRIAAGDIEPRALEPGSAVRIFTGAPIPAGADTVAMQEDCTSTNDIQVAIPLGLKHGANLRKAGEDLAAGAEIAQAGDRLRPQDLAAFASIGLTEIPVFEPLKVALISSGNEIQRPGKPLKHGQVYDSNHFLLASLLKAINVETTDLGILPDDRSVVQSTIEQASRNFDVILSTGGASRGEEDHLIDTLNALGKCHLWQLAIKPGRPMSFGQIANTVMFGLPGNPVASFVCFLLYVRPALMRLGGARWTEPDKFPLPCNFEISSKKPDRREFWRGYLANDPQHGLCLEKFARDGSGLISGLRKAGGLIEVPEKVTSIKKGDYLDFIPFSQFF